MLETLNIKFPCLIKNKLSGVSDMASRVGPSATIRCEPRQIRKEAAAAADSCAGVWLAWFASLFSRLTYKPI